MASLVLGVAGSFIGSFAGPLGASIGWSIGSMIGNLIDPKKIEGPRLTDLKLQASQYGQMIPIVYGTARMSGNVIWQTDLVEHSETSDGKGGPEVTTYSYTASFAVQLCEGPIVAVTRIWADGRLIHDTTSYASEASVPFTLYLGDETQEPDSRMEAELGAGNVPAYRGTAYIVFEDMPLGDYGNRLPNLTFEVTTNSPEDTVLHIVKKSSGLEIEYEHNSGGQGRPYITSWDTRDGGKVVIKTLDGQIGHHDYNDDDLSYSGETGYPGEGGYPDLKIIRSTGVQHIIYAYCGTVLYSGTPTEVYANPSFATNAASGVTDAGLIADSAWTADDVTTTATAELACSAGIPDGEHIVGVAITEDKTAMLVITSTDSTPDNATTWYMLVDGAIIDQGTVDASFTTSAGYFYSRSTTTFSYNAAILENNREWLWWATGAGASNTVGCYHIDQTTNVLSFYDTGDYAGGNDIVVSSFARISIYTMAEGYCGIATTDALAVISRYPTHQPAGPPLSEVVTDLSERAGLAADEIDVTALADDSVDGYVIAQQGAVRGAIAQLQSAYFFDAVESGADVKFVKRGGTSVVTIADDDLAAVAYGSEPPALMSTARRQEIELPRSVSVNYPDRDADYQQGTQIARREVTNSELTQTVGLAVVMTTTKAKQVADVLLFDEWLRRESFSFYTGRKYAYLEPTDVVTVRDREVRITSKDEGGNGVIKFDAVPSHTKLWIAGPAGVSGDGFSQPAAAVVQATNLVMLDIPLTDDSQATVGVQVAMAGATSTRWRGASLQRSSDGGTNYASVGQYNTASPLGQTADVLADFSGGNVFDELSTVTVELTQGSGDLESKSETLVLNGENEAVIGSEIVRFKNATLVSAGRYRLTGLLRGCRGTEWAMGTHAALERFVLLPANDLSLSASDINADRLYKAVTVGNSLASANAVPFRFQAIRLKPHAPVHVGGGVDASGNVTINWTRRSRLATGGINGSVPLGESSEEYVLQIWNAARTQVARIVTGITSPTYQYTAAMQVTDFGATQQTIYVSVGQVGAYALGYEAEAEIAGTGVDDDAPLAPVDPYTAPLTEAPAGATNVDQAHWDNFATLYNAGGRDRQLAYKYTALGPVQGIAWWQRYQYQILNAFFGGDSWARALWIQDADLSPPIDGTEAAYLSTLLDLAEP
jgi:hypothetical protein